MEAEDDMASFFYDGLRLSRSETRIDQSMTSSRFSVCSMIYMVAKMSFDKISDLTAGVYFNIYNMQDFSNTVAKNNCAAFCMTRLEVLPRHVCL